MRRGSQLDHLELFDTRPGLEVLQPVSYAILHPHIEHKLSHTILLRGHNFHAYDRQLQFHHQGQLHVSSTTNYDNYSQHPSTDPDTFSITAEGTNHIRRPIR